MRVNKTMRKSIQTKKTNKPTNVKTYNNKSNKQQRNINKQYIYIIETKIKSNNIKKHKQKPNKKNNTIIKTITNK